MQPLFAVSRLKSKTDNGTCRKRIFSRVLFIFQWIPHENLQLFEENLHVRFPELLSCLNKAVFLAVSSPISCLPKQSWKYPQLWKTADIQNCHGVLLMFPPGKQKQIKKLKMPFLYLPIHMLALFSKKCYLAFLIFIKESRAALFYA